MKSLWNRLHLLAVATVIGIVFLSVEEVLYWRYGHEMIANLIMNRSVGELRGQAGMAPSTELVDYVVNCADQLHNGFLILLLGVFGCMAVFFLRRQTSVLDEVEQEINSEQPSWWQPVLLLTLSALILVLPPMFLYPPDVFICGDGGVKYLQIRSFLENGLRSTSLQIPASHGAMEIWEKYDSFPIQPPFAYPAAGQWYMSFPMLFPLLCVPVFGLFGFRGLGLMPVAATVVTVGLLSLLWKGTRFRWWKALAVVFGTPVTFYSLVFWEHTWALPFVVGSLLLLLRVRSSHSAWLAGSLLATGVFFRSEMLAMIPGFLFLFSRSNRREIGRFLAGAGAVLVLYVIFNYVTVGAVLPRHAQQLEGMSLPVKVFRVAYFWVTMVQSLFKTAPFLALGVLALAGTSQIEKRLLAVGAAFTIFAALIVPNTGSDLFGPRFLLPVVPIFGYVALNRISALKTIWVRSLAVVLILASVRTCFLQVNRDLYRVMWTTTYPLVSRVAAEDGVDCLLVGHSFIAQECAAVLRGKDVFVVGEASFLPILESLRERRVNKVLLITYLNDQWGSFYCSDERICELGGHVLATLGQGYRVAEFILRSDDPR